MQIKDLLSKLKGTQTVESVRILLRSNRQKAVYSIYRLRKAGYVKTSRKSDSVRIYSILPSNKIGGINYIDVINKYSPVKIVSTRRYITYGKKPSLEEILIFALKTKNLRIILASLSLFSQITNWSLLYKLAKEEGLIKETIVLYEIARKIRKIRKMPLRFKNLAGHLNRRTFSYLIPNLKSDDFQELENKWKVHIPFNKKDLEEYL